MKTMTIGQVAREAGLGVETLRFYEREGLLPEPDRRASGYRQYDPAVVGRLRFIQRAKALGFTLREIKELLLLHEDEDATRADVKQRTREKIADIEAKIADLQRMRAALTSLTESCDGAGPLDGCPIIAALAGGGRADCPSC
ncbi:MAG: heavy metal-responsive transcriptional regulator [Gemmataceae bacterium]